MPESSLKIGDKAPDFTLKDEHGTSVSLSDFRDKQAVVLIFYPGDMTPGCTMQLCAVRDDWQKFQEANIALFGVNHANADSHEAFIKKHSFPFPLLIDTGKKVSERYGAIRGYFKVQIIRRSVIGVDKDGVIRYLKRGMPKDADILKIMKQYS